MALQLLDSLGQLRPLLGDHFLRPFELFGNFIASILGYTGLKILVTSLEVLLGPLIDPLTLYQLQVGGQLDPF